MGPLHEQEPTMVAATPPRVRMEAVPHRVLLYTTCYNVIDGVTLTIRKLEQEIVSSGGHICILTTKSGDAANTDLYGTHPNRQVLFLDNSVPIPFLHDPNNGDLTYHAGLGLSRGVKAKIEEFEPSLVHITVPDNTALHLVDFARNKELPLMGTYHSNIPEYMDHYPGVGWAKHILTGFFRHQYNFFQALYVPTPFIHKYLSDTYKFDKITNLRVWGRGIDLEKFSPTHRSLKFRHKLGIDDQDVVVCWVGRLVPEKRPDIFANVIRRLHARNVPFHALVIGAGQDEEMMKALPNTTCTGWMSGSDLSVAYASSDMFLFPSSVETFGNVTLEAAASGLPLVVESGCSGHLVRDGENGYTCVAGDEDSFFEATLSLIVDNERRAAFSEASRELSMSFEQRDVLSQMIDNYSQVTDEFYCDYGGRHRNRDRLFWKEDSFLGGSHPRTLVLMLVEFFVMSVCMRIMWYVVSGIFWFKDVLAIFRMFRRHDRASLATFDRVVTMNNSKGGKLSSLGKGGQVVVVDEEFGLEDVVLGTDSLTTDDETSSTLSSTSESSSGPSLICPKPSTPDCVAEIPSKLSIAFVKTMQCQFRTESLLRHAVSNCCSESKFDRQERKRKNSSMQRVSSEVWEVTPTSRSLSNSRHLEQLERRVRRTPHTV